MDCARRIAIWAGLDEEGGYQCERWTMMMMMDEADQLAWRARLVSLSVGIDASRFKVTCSRASSLVAACLSLSLPSATTLNIMGKRKKSSRKPTGPRRRDPLGQFHVIISIVCAHNCHVDTTFTCLFCHHDQSVTVRLDKKEGIAHLSCKICDQRFQDKANGIISRYPFQHPSTNGSVSCRSSHRSGGCVPSLDRCL